MATLQTSKAPPDLCRRKLKSLLQNNVLISQASNPAQWGLPLPSHLAGTWEKEKLNGLHSGAVLVATRTPGSSAESPSPLPCHQTPVPALWESGMAASDQQDWSLWLLITISTLFFQTFKVFAVLSVTITSYKALLRRENNMGASETW